MSASDANAQSSSSSADSTNLTWTEPDQDMLDDLNCQGETTTELVTRSVNELLSPDDSTIALRAEIMSSGADWQARTGAFIRRFPALNPALEREMGRPTQSVDTNSPTQPMETDLRCAAERCHNALVVLRNKCSEYKAANTAVSLTQLDWMSISAQSPVYKARSGRSQ
jgi:hypothetical protein